MIILKNRIALLCLDRIRMLVFHTLLSFFAGGILALEDEEQRLVETNIYITKELVLVAGKSTSAN